jgi:dienelactone hydrolase
MFWRSQRTGTLAAEGPEREAAWERLRATISIAARDAKTAADWLRGSAFCSGKVAVIGFAWAAAPIADLRAPASMPNRGLCARYPASPTIPMACRLPAA